MKLPELAPACHDCGEPLDVVVNTTRNGPPGPPRCTACIHRRKKLRRADRPKRHR